MAKNCPHCGTPASSNDKFCNNCGHNLRTLNRGTSDETRNDAYRSTSVRKKSVESHSSEPDYDPDAYVPDRGLWQKFFTFKGRLNPARYVLRMTVLLMSIYFIELLLTIFIEKFQVRVPPDFFLYLTIGTLLLAFPLSVRRAHDMGRPGWWAVLGVLPIISAAFEMCNRKVHWVDRWGEHHEANRWSDLGAVMSIIYLTFMLSFAIFYFIFRSGVDGENQYGSDPTGECAPRPLESNPILGVISWLEEGDYSTLKVGGAVMLIFFSFNLLMPALGFGKYQSRIFRHPALSRRIENSAPRSEDQYPAVKDEVKQMLEATPPPVVNEPPQPQVVAQPLTNDNQRAAVQSLINFHDGITNKNFQSAYTCFSRGMQSEISYEGWTPGFATTVSSTVSEVRVVNESPNAIELNYVLTAVDNINGRESTAKFNGTATMINEDGQWKLDFIKNKVR